MSELLLETKGVCKYFPIRRGLLRSHVGDVKAVDDVSLQIFRGETLGLVGESGCGKTTLGRLLLRAHEPTGGTIAFWSNGTSTDVTSLNGRALRDIRKRMQLIFQDPFSSLNPRMTVKDIIGEPLLCYGMTDARSRTARVAELLNLVGLDTNCLTRYPHAFSGGQRQRIGIARAIALNPDLIIADEAVSALDVSIQAQILNLLEDLQNRLQLTYLFISHDLGVVQHVSDRVAVMYLGRLVEIAPTRELFLRPRHPYVEALLSSVPRPDPSYQLDQFAVKGEVADPARAPSGCPFHPRCPYVRSICRETLPPLVRVPMDTDDIRRVACHRADSLELRGVDRGTSTVQ